MISWFKRSLLAQTLFVWVIAGAAAYYFFDDALLATVFLAVVIIVTGVPRLVRSRRQ
jgi:uncharacterized membrane protein HdeD (DUF308 family)